MAKTQTKGELEVEATTTPEAPEVENNSNPKPQEPAPEVSDLPCTPDSTPEMPKSERVKMNEFVSYEGFNGEIECTYVHFNRKDKAISWGK
jgi:hypothetical protein